MSSYGLLFSGFILAQEREQAEDIKETIRQVAISQDIDTSENNWLQAIVNAIGRKLGQLIEKMFDSFGTPDKANFTIIAIAILFLLVVITIGYVLISRRRRVRVQDALMQEILMHSAGEWLAKAQEAYQMGNFNDALLHRWRSVIAQAIVKGVVADNKGKTTKAIEKEIQMVTSHDFALMTRTFEGIRYGGKQGNMEQYQQLDIIAHAVSKDIGAANPKKLGFASTDIKLSKQLEPAFTADGQGQ